VSIGLKRTPISNDWIFQKAKEYRALGAQEAVSEAADAL
jgi:hypothetical protein